MTVNQMTTLLVEANRILPSPNAMAGSIAFMIVFAIVLDLVFSNSKKAR